MAGVKQQELAIEEKLEQALVPEDEWPYEVPGNWVWTRLGKIANFIGGGTPSKSVAAYWNGDIPWASVKDIKGDYLTETIDKITSDGLKNSASNYCDIDELILVTRIEPGKTIISKIQAAINQDLKIVKSSLPSKYLHYFFLNNRHEFVKLSSGSTVLGITLDNVASIKFPLPPLPEQQRIVDRIESLFAKLDQAKELAQNALDTFETRKAAILHKAFTGELTAKWREKNGVGMESWEEKVLNEICKISSGGTPSRNNPEFYNGNIPWVKTGEIEWNYISDSEEKITEEAIANSSAKLFPAGTVLVAMYGQGLTRGRAAILGINATTNQAVCALMPCKNICNRFLFYYFMKNYWIFREKAVGGNQPNYSGTMIGRFSIILPSIPEQQEIVRILDSILEKEQKAKELCDVIDKIDLMKKVILARAFRGELGTNDPSEESAVELLKECL